MVLADQHIDEALRWVETGLRRGRPFVIMPSQVHELRTRRADVAAEIKARIQAGLVGDYQADSISFDTIPKKGNTGYRHAPSFSVVDEGVFSWAVTSHYAQILDYLGQPEPMIDYARSLPRHASDDGWIENFMEPYRAFRACMRQFHEQGQSVLCLDIRNFAPSTKPVLMYERLQEAGMNPAVADILLQAMTQWRERDGLEGIPLGSLSCDIFIKLLLRPVDIAMREKYGPAYFRYMDDIRVAFASEAQAADMIEDMQSLLAPMGLELNTAKTKIMTPDTSWRESLIQTLSGYGFNLPEGADEEHAVEMMNDDDLRSLYKNHIRPVLYGGGQNMHGPLRAIVRETLKTMGTRQMAEPLADLDELLRGHPMIVRYTSYYIERGRFFDETAAQLIAALETPGMPTFEHYALFRTLNRHYAQAPSRIASLIAPWADRTDYPDYMRNFAADTKRVCVPLAACDLRHDAARNLELA